MVLSRCVTDPRISSCSNPAKVCLALGRRVIARPGRDNPPRRPGMCGGRLKPLKIYRSRPLVLKNGNFGDELTELLLERLFGRSTQRVRLEEAEFIGVGSILDAYWRQKQAASGRQRVKHFLRNALRRSPDVLHVWGAGAMLDDSEIVWRQRPIYHAVRGKLTASRLGEVAPSVLGDPGILAPLLLDREPAPDTPVALVPHFVDEHEIQALDLPRHWKIVHTDRDAVDTIRAIAGSELVISSSLHGLITADAFGIPCIWARSVNDLYKRSLFKFHDHETARGTPFGSPHGYAELASRSEHELTVLSTRIARDREAWRASLIAAFPAELIP